MTESTERTLLDLNPLAPADFRDGHEPAHLLSGGATLSAHDVSAWLGHHKVLDRVSLTMAAGVVTALIGPSGCGKSTFLRILNRMHELVASAALAGEVRLDGDDIYASGRRVTDTRKRIGMVIFDSPTDERTNDYVNGRFG